MIFISSWCLYCSSWLRINWGWLHPKYSQGYPTATPTPYTLYIRLQALAHLLERSQCEFRLRWNFKRFDRFSGFSLVVRLYAPKAGRIRWFEKKNRKIQTVKNRTIATRIQRLKSHFIATTTQVYIQKVETSGIAHSILLRIVGKWSARCWVLRRRQGDDVSEGKPCGLNEFNDCLLNQAKKGKYLEGVTTPYMYFDLARIFRTVTEFLQLPAPRWKQNLFFVPIEYSKRLPKLFIEGCEKCENHLTSCFLKKDSQFSKRGKRKVYLISLFRMGWFQLEP